MKQKNQLAPYNNNNNNDNNSRVCSTHSNTRSIVLVVSVSVRCVAATITVCPAQFFVCVFQHTFIECAYAPIRPTNQPISWAN